VAKGIFAAILVGACCLAAQAQPQHSEISAIQKAFIGKIDRIYKMVLIKPVIAQELGLDRDGLLLYEKVILQSASDMEKRIFEEAKDKKFESEEALAKWVQSRIDYHGTQINPLVLAYREKVFPKIHARWSQVDAWLVFYTLGPEAFYKNRLFESLKLTETQAEELRRMVNPFKADLMHLRATGEPDPLQPGQDKILAEKERPIYRKYHERCRAVFTGPQLTTFDKLFGKPFDIDFCL